MKKILSILVSLILVTATVCSTSFCGVQAVSRKGTTAEELLIQTAEENTYDYFLQKTAYPFSSDEFVLNVQDAENKDGSLSWFVNSPKAVRYTVYVKYYATSDSIIDAECTLLINGQLQYSQLGGFVLQKEYKNAVDEVEKDIYGNHITPEQVISEELIGHYVFDYAGVYAAPLSVNLEKGTNLIELQYPADDIKIEAVELRSELVKDDYNEYIKNLSAKKSYSGKVFNIEGEAADLKSDTMLYPESDKTSPLVSPVENGKIILNTIGGGNWKTANQYIKWTVNVPESAFYTISIKYKQNQNIGQQSRRMLYINGKVPFKEASNLVFDYSSGWQLKTLSNEKESFLFYLEKGQNEITLQATLGETDAVTRAIDNCVSELNEIYRKLLVVIGSEPDMSKDYKLDKTVPEVLDQMLVVAGRLDAAAAILREFTDKNSATAATLDTISRQLKKMNKDSDEVPSEFSYFKTNIGSLGTCQSQAKQQPLLVDYISFGGENPKLLKAEGNFFQKLWFNILEYLYSFIIDYKNIGSLNNANKNAKTVTAWISSGRDQAQIIRNLVSEDFTPRTGNGVKLELVNAASLLPATVAGIGPDVYIGLGSNAVIDYSMRNAAYNLKEFKDFDKTAEKFYPETFIPLEYMDGVYAIPMSMSFNVLYYRKDILADLGLEIPQTWDDVIAMSSVLSVNNMSFGLPSGNGSYLMMLKQKGLDVYTEDGAKCLLDSSDAIDVFKYYTNFYNNYGFSLTYSLVNRFRTGETPIAVDSIGIYNSLEISAPEIKGLWDFTVVPGFKDENGNVNHTSIVSGSAVMLLKNSKLPKESWEFIKWLTSAEIQSKYGVEIESLLGSSGRYTSANVDAIMNSCWNKSERETIALQTKSLSAIEQVPGSYYLTRNLDNAFRNAVYYDKKPMDVMYDYVYKINSELNEKRKELGLNLAS